MSGWFGGINLSNISVHVTPQGGGADWNGSSSSSTVEIKAEGQTFSASPDFIRYLLVAEVTEIMMLTQNIGWFQGTTRAARARGSHASSARSSSTPRPSRPRHPR